GRRLLGRDAVTDELAVHTGQRREEVQLVRVQTTAGPFRRNPLGDLAVDLRLARVTQSQLDPGTQQVLERRADFRPPVRRDDQVDAERQTVGRQVEHVRLEALEVLPERPPTVDQQ